jgi:hypothetical protein
MIIGLAFPGFRFHRVSGFREWQAAGFRFHGFREWQVVIEPQL